MNVEAEEENSTPFDYLSEYNKATISPLPSRGIFQKISPDIEAPLDK